MNFAKDIALDVAFDGVCSCCVVRKYYEAIEKFLCSDFFLFSSDGVNDALETVASCFAAVKAFTCGFVGSCGKNSLLATFTLKKFV